MLQGIAIKYVINLCCIANLLCIKTYIFLFERKKKMRFFKKTKTKIVATLLAVTMVIVGMPISVSAVASTPPQYVTASADKALWAEGTEAITTNNIDAVKWYAKNGTYYWSLPSSADLSNLTVYHNFDSVKINGNTITSGNSYSFFENGQTYTVIADGAEYNLCVQKATGIGSIFLTTESGSMRTVHSSKDNKESGQLVAIDYDGSVSYDDKLDSIKGRGHSTWRLAKKPYNIKLDKKASLLGMDKNKKWCLLANAQDNSMIRNVFMYDLANELGLDFSPESRFVDLYANGQYLGTYQLTQKIEAGDGELVDITDLQKNTEEAVANALGIEDADLEELYGNNVYSVNEDEYYNSRKGFNIPYNPDDITGGYLMEFVVDIDEPSSFITDWGQAVNMKAPEYCSAEQINYIADFMQDLEDALFSDDGYNTKGKHYTEYIDIRSAAIMYILQEFSLNIDGGISSCYFYKDSDITGDGKVHASPCWDFDVALGNLDVYRDGVSMKDYSSWFTRYSYTIFGQLCQHDDFMSEVEKIWNTEFLSAFDIAIGKAEGTGRLKSIYDYDALLESSSIMNYTRWNLSSTLLVPESGATQDEQMRYLETFINGRFEFLNAYFSNMLGYEGNERIQDLEGILSNFKSEYSYDIPEEKDVIDRVTAIVDQAKIDINNAQSLDEINNIYYDAVYDMQDSQLTVIYFDNSKTQWENVYIYCKGYNWWDDEDNVIEGEELNAEMTYMGDNIYKFSYIGSPYSQLSTIMFNNGESEESGNRRQTEKTSYERFYEIRATYVPSSAEGKYSEADKAYIYKGRWDSESVRADVSKDCEIDLMDAVLIMKHLLGSYELDNIAMQDADVDYNRKVELLDAVYIQKYIIGLIDEFPYNGPEWWE